jgi:hypothetical protein
LTRRQRSGETYTLICQDRDFTAQEFAETRRRSCDEVVG